MMLSKRSKFSAWFIAPFVVLMPTVALAQAQAAISEFLGSIEAVFQTVDFLNAFIFSASAVRMGYP